MRLSGDELRALAFIVPLAALAGCVAAYKLHAPDAVVPRGFDLVGRVTHIRDGDTIEVSAVTGGTGAYADAPAEIRQTLLGMNDGDGVRLQMPFADPFRRAAGPRDRGSPLTRT